MARQSFRCRLGARLLPIASQRVFPADWLEAGGVGRGHDAPTYDVTDLLLPIESIRRDGQLYAGSLGVTDPVISPRYATDDELATLPPMAIALGENELFVPEGTEFAERIRAVGGSALVITEPFGQPASSMLSTPESAQLRETVTATLRGWFDDGEART